MTIYMIHDEKTGLYYKRGPDHRSNWVPKEKASVWTTAEGPRACLGTITRRNHQRHAVIRKPVIEISKTVPIVGKYLPDIAIVDGDDWEGLYLNGKLVQQGHHVRLEDIFKHLDIQATFIVPDQQWLEDCGSLPARLDEVKQESE